jgi:REP element-mobilizing transposase RayT
MKYNPHIHRRRSIRLPLHNYAKEGEYFITIVGKDRECLFGSIIDGEMQLSDIGQIVRDEWLRTHEIRPYVELDEFVVMPNHVHGILVITGRGTSPPPVNSRRGVSQYAPTGFKSPSETVGAIIRGFKSATTKRINQFRNSPGTPVWQRNYYERVIRDERELDQTRAYIADNIVHWQSDEENPAPTRAVR